MMINRHVPQLSRICSLAHSCCVYLQICGKGRIDIEPSLDYV